MSLPFRPLHPSPHEQQFPTQPGPAQGSSSALSQANEQSPREEALPRPQCSLPSTQVPGVQHKVHPPHVESFPGHGPVLKQSLEMAAFSLAIVLRTSKQLAQQWGTATGKDQ